MGFVYDGDQIYGLTEEFDKAGTSLATLGNVRLIKSAGGTRIEAEDSEANVVAPNATVETIAAMLAMSASLNEGNVVVTRGYNAADDGGGNPEGYTYHQTARPGSENGGFILFGTDGSGVDWFSHNNQTVANAAQFGAVGDNLPTSGTVNSTAINAAIAAFVLLNDSEGATIPQKVTEVLIPPGDYYVDSTLVCDCTDNPNLVLRGGGRDITRIIAADSLIPAPLFQFTNTTTNGTRRCEFGSIEEITFTGTSPTAGQPDDVLDLTAMNHMVIKKVRVLGGAISGVNLGYCIATSFVDCLVSHSQRFGMRCTETTFNDISFRGTGFLLNTVCGFYTAHSAYRNLNFFGCAFEQNGTVGAYFMEVLGLTIHGCYTEINGETAPHTFLTRGGAALLDGNWDVRGDYCLAGRPTVTDDDNLPTDTGEFGCQSVSMQGNEWSPNVADQRHVILAGVNGAEIQQPADSMEQPWVESQNGRSLWKNVALIGRQDHVGPHITYAASSFISNNISLGQVDGNRFSWVPKRLQEIELGRGTDTGNSTWTAKMTFPGETVFSSSDTVAGTGDYNDLAQRLVGSDFIGQQCIVEAFCYFMTSENAGNYNCGLQVSCQDVGGLKQSSTNAQPLNPNDAVTTGTVSAASAALTVADATGIRGGDPIVVKGAGVGGIDLATVADSVAGLVVTLRDAATTEAIGAEVRAVRLSRMRFIVEPVANLADGKTTLQARRTGGAAFDEVWIDRITMRVFGSDENMQPFQDPKVLRSVGSPEGVVSGGIGYQCTDTTGAAGEILFLKTTAVGKSGWLKLVETA